jgi:hypothetical protein
MKKYKTWELLKMAEENKNLGGNVREREPQYINKDGVIVAFGRNGYGKGLFEENGFPASSELVNTEWELIQQPVEFMEAVKAYSEGKTIRCEIGEETRIYDYKVGYGMTNIRNYAITVGEILNGKWFISEDTNE